MMTLPFGAGALSLVLGVHDEIMCTPCVYMYFFLFSGHCEIATDSIDKMSEEPSSLVDSIVTECLKNIRCDVVSWKWV